jgi:plasmid stability protein
MHQLASMRCIADNGHVKPITVRNLPPQVARAVRERAKADHTSLNGAVIRLLEERLAAAPVKSAKKPHHDLDFLAGTWTADEANEFDESLAFQRSIDPDLWR